MESLRVRRTSAPSAVLGEGAEAGVPEGRLTGCRATDGVAEDLPRTANPRQLPQNHGGDTLYIVTLRRIGVAVVVVGLLGWWGGGGGGLAWRSEAWGGVGWGGRGWRG